MATPLDPRAALLGACLSLITGAVAADTAGTRAQAASIQARTGTTSWHVSFEFKQPTREFFFVRNPRGGARTDWRPLDETFVLVHENGTDRVRRRDNGSFARATFAVPVRFEPFEDDYAAFAPSGDGGLLSHSGRFHACATSCPRDARGDEGPWPVVFEAAAGTALVHAGQHHRQRVAWSDTGDGTLVHIGARLPVDNEALTAVIDATLPAGVRLQLEAELPALLAFYHARLGLPPSGGKPTLFVSFDPTPRADGRFGSKGGVLNGVVYMHLYGAGWRDTKASAGLRDWLPWFFAHETAHLFQRHEHSRDPADLWIHEGGAEAFALLALRSLDPSSATALEQRLRAATADCGRGLERGPLKDAHARGQTNLHYACGLVMQVALAETIAARTQGATDLFGVWRTFLRRVEGGAPWSTATFLATAREFGLDDLAARVQAIATTPLVRPREDIEGLHKARPR